MLAGLNLENLSKVPVPTGTQKGQIEDKKTPH